MELYQWVIAGLITLLLGIILSENDRVNQLVWNDLLAAGRHIESVLHPTHWRYTDPKKWEFVCLNDGSWGVIPRTDWPKEASAAWNSEPYDVLPRKGIGWPRPDHFYLPQWWGHKN